MRIGVVGLNHKLANLRLRDLIARVTEHRFGAGNALHPNQHTVVLSTCNRTEVYFSSSNLSDSQSYLLNVLRGDIGEHVEDFDQKLYTYFGKDCFSHLARVTAGLDSAIIAETEIQGQVKGAYEKASEYSKLPYELHFMFQKVLRIGKQVRQHLPLDRGLPHLEHAIHHAGNSFFAGRLDPKILLVGASEINRQVLAFLQKKGWQNITLCNRTKKHALPIVNHYNIPYTDLEELQRWHHYDWVILGTKASEPLITHAEKTDHKTLLIDLSVPRNVSPELASAAQISLLNIDQLNRTLQKRRRHHDNILEQAEKMVSSLSQKHVATFSSKTRLQELVKAI